MSMRVFAVFAVLAAVARAGDQAQYPQPIAPDTSNDGQVAALDVNGDGLKDLLVTDSNVSAGEKVASLLLSTGTPLAYGAPQTVSLGLVPYDIGTGDFDGDGDTDLASVDASSNRVHVLPNLGNGSLGPFVNVPLPASSIAFSTADTDQDGDLDLVLDKFSGGGFLVVRNDGGGQFSVQPTVMPSESVTSLATGDMDNDGLVDCLLRTDLQSFKFVVAKGTGGNQFTTGPVSPSLPLIDFVLGDFDDDAWLDVAVWSTNPPYAWVHHGVGGGALAPKQDIGNQPNWAPVGVDGLAAGDADGDGDDDLALWGLPGSPTQDVIVARSEGGAVAVPPDGVVAVGGRPFDAIFTDIDGDGLQDLVSGDISHSLVVTRGVPGGLEKPKDVSVPDLVQADHVTADFTLDGCEDVLVQHTLQTAVLPGSPSGGLGAPINSGFVGFGEFWWPRAAGDFDGDGLPDAVGARQIGASLGLRVVRGLGDGKLVNGPDAQFGGVLVTHAAAADLDLDGDLDLAASNGAFFARYLNNGAAGFTQLLAPASAVLAEVRSGDLDADGLPDVVSGVPSRGALELRFNTGGGALAPAVSLPGLNADFGLGDVDGDGRPEIVAGHWVSAGAPDVVVLRALPGGGFGTATASSGLAAGTSPAILGVADATGDGLADVMAASGQRLALLRTDAVGGLLPGRISLLPPGAASTLDANGDGAADLVLVDSVKLHLLPCTPGEPRAAWTTLGYALAGGNGLPTLTGSGTLVAGTPAAVDLANAKANTPALIFVGSFPLLTPWKGGTVVPSLDFSFPLVTDAGGSLHLEMTWPAGVPSGLDVFLQVWVKDAGGPSGFAASNGLRALTP